MRGFGHITSNYMLMQIGVTVAYQLTDQFSIGLAPTFNYASLEMSPNPTTNPDMSKGYPVAEQTGTTGFGGQVGIFFDSKKSAQVSHVGIYLGGGNFIHASSAKEKVTISNLSSNYYAKHFKWGRRVTNLNYARR